MQKECKNILIFCGSDGSCMSFNDLSKELRPHFNVLETKNLKEYTAHLNNGLIDCVVICSYLTDKKSKEVVFKKFLEVPHIIVTEINHQNKIQKLLSKGLKDYIITTNTARLLPAVKREIAAFSVRKKAHQAINDLKKSKKEMLIHLKNAPLATISWDIDFKVINWNKAATNLFGYTYNESVGKHCTELLTPKHLLSNAKSIIKKLINQKGKTSNINETLTKSGAVLICHWHNTILKGLKGETLGIISTIEDITQKELSRKDLLRQQSLLQQAQKLSEVHFIEIGIEKNKIVLDEEFILLSGLKPQKFYKAETLLKDLVHPKDKVKLIKTYKTAIEDNSKLAVDFRVIYNDGTVRWVNVLADKFIDEITQEKSFIGTFIDVTDRKNKLIKLEDQKQRLNMAIDIAKIGFIDLDFETNEVKIFGKTNQIFDLDKNKTEFNFKELLSRIHPNDATKVNEAFTLSKTENKSFQVNHRLLLPSGNIIWVNSLGEVVCDKNNKPSRLLGTVRDITPQIKRERRLLQHSLILNQINSLVVVMNDKADYIFVSPAINRLTGYTIDDVLGQGWWNKSYISEEEKGKHKKEFLSILENPIEINDLKYERKVRCKDGSIKWFSWQYSRGTENTVIGLAHDVTEEKEKEYMVTKLFKAIESSPTVVMITDIKGTIEFVNPKFEEVTGYTADEIIGKTPRVLSTGYTSRDEYSQLWKTILKGDVWKGEFKNKKKNGNHFWESAIITPVKNAEGIITNFIALKEDITEKKAQEKKFLYALFEAQENEKLKFGEELHDSLSQILSAMSFYLDAVLNPKNTKDHLKVEYLKKVRQLSEDALRESRHISHGLMSKQLLKAGLMSATEEICENYNVSRKIKFIFKKTNYKEDYLSPQIKQNIYRIIQEITTNIVRHSQSSEAKISFGIEHEKNFILEIQDNGIGMDQKVVKQKSKSFGLKNIEQRVKLLNGTIKRESEIDKGTKYKIKIPIVLESVTLE